MDTLSQHLILDALCQQELNSDHIEAIKNIIEKNLTVVQKIEHKFSPQGETIVFILSESHFSIHTYPEHNYFSLDIYVCNMTTDLKSIVEQIKNVVELKKIDMRILERGRLAHKKESVQLKQIYFVTVIIACCSILYEFLLAQSISTTMGNTALRYNLTIGLFIASMGFGALFYKKIIKDNYFREFVKIEILLSIIGGLAPIVVLIFDRGFNFGAKFLGFSFFSPMIQWPLFAANHLLIVIIGFLSGLELPLLMDMTKEFKSTKGHLVLAFDYLGTLLGAILFPLIILPNLHIFTIGYVVSLINILVAFFVFKKLTIHQSKLQWLLISMLILWCVVIIYSESLNHLLIEQFYFSGGIQ